MKSVFALGSGLAVAVTLVSIVPACSSTPGAVVCDPAQCAPGNECLAMDGEVKCRKPCESNVVPATSCPAGYTCAASNAPSILPAECIKASPATTTTACAPFVAGGTKLTAFACGATLPKGCVAADDQGTYCCNEAPPETFAKTLCVKQYREATPGPKQWGAPCNPTKGLDTNDDCDVAQGFSCYGTSPADANAYCTRYTCNTDRECGAGFFCGTINVAPNVATATPTRHETTTACLRRDYCAPCKADLDCPPLNGVLQHCVPDDNYVGFCAPECATRKNCNFEAVCMDGGIGVNTCYPLAGTCIGDASLCSPCRADSDCGDDGLCVKGQYTTEKFCAKKSATSCKDGGKKTCPASSADNAQIGCSTADGDVPADYCLGLYNFGPPSGGQQGRDLGCYTPAR